MTRLMVAAVGRLRSGPERDLVDSYLTRAGKAGRGLGFTLSPVLEVEDKKGGGMAAEALLLERAVPGGARLIALDERGRGLSSPEFSRRLASWRDSGAADIACIIGGADGLDPDLIARADLVVSPGRDGLAAYAGARDARRANLPSDVHFGRQSLPQGVSEFGLGACYIEAPAALFLCSPKQPLAVFGAPGLRRGYFWTKDGVLGFCGPRRIAGRRIEGGLS